MSEPGKRRIIIALSISALLNVFLIGFMAARAIYAPGRHGPPPALFGEDGKDRGMRRVWRKHGDRLRPTKKAMRQAQRKVRSALTARPYDPAALESALSDMRSRTGEAQVELHRALVDLAGELDDGGRERLARSPRIWHTGPGPRRPPGGGKRGPPRQP